ncbi:MAG: hypothetical protein J6C46_12240 [Clostridia bacterium]|nr:hypothetical protein [Clostridia bacterium]
MKNLIEELHKLDEYEYNVSENFTKNVMKNIKRDNKTIKFSSVISCASVGIVACLAVIVFSNSSVKESALNSYHAQSAESVVNVANSIADKMDNTTSDSVNNSTNNFANNPINSPAVKEDKENVFDNFIVDRMETITAETDKHLELKDAQGSASVNGYMENNVVEDNSFRKEENIEKIKKIENIFKAKKIEYKIVDNKVEVKSTIKVISELLKDIENILIEVKEGYVIVKVN